MVTTPRTLLLAAAACACTLAPSPLGALPDDTSATAGTTMTSAASTSASTTSSDTSTTATSRTTSSSSITTSESDTDPPPGSAWDHYCEYVQSRGGRCDPDVDDAPDLSYPGSGFLVHEWGTDTVILGADGAPLRGLHHEDMDLPAFVYDRVGAGSLDGSVSVHVKMETPVTYFYADTARSVDVAVGFPKGVFSHWYPAVARFEPYVAAPGSIPKLIEHDDPALNPSFPFASELCRGLYAVVDGGLLDWGTIEILDRDVDLPLADAPLSETTWSYARAVASNLVEVSAVPGADPPQHERFLFYRGVGNFPLPLTITAAGDDAIEVANDSSVDVGRVFVIQVDDARGAFFEWSEGVAAGQMFPASAPPLASAAPLDLFVDALAERVTEALDATGLYHDEALAMVATWREQWFRTPGLRLLYLVPQAWTDASIPLSLAPTPDAVLRVMMIRSEILTPEQELIDVDAAALLAAPDTYDAGRGHFIALGRFAEPRLRRASALLGEPSYVAALLGELLHADARVAVGE